MSSPVSESMMGESFDEAVRSTNTEACDGKLSAIRKGYWQEPALERLAVAARLHPVFKQPEINRGYFARVTAMRKFVDDFVKITECKCQIVNLGSGFDTLFWRLHENHRTVENFIELDFPGIAMKKSNAIKKDKTLSRAVCPDESEMTTKAGDFHAKSYHLMGCDLRCLTEVRSKLTSAGVRPDLPTLFIAECVLVYMRPDACQKLLEWISQSFPEAALVSYEQVNLNDRFGEVMQENLIARGCPLVGAEYCGSLETQNQRFLSTGWRHVRSWDMETIWNSFPERERRRVESIEMLDEEVLLVQLMQHYCIVFATQSDKFSAIALDRDL